MRRWLLWGLVVAPLCAVLAMGLRPEPPVGAEVERIQRHLSRVARVLRSTTPERMTEEQLEARRATLAWLDEYRAAGVFPHNHVRPGERVPVFVDPHGTPCAVGYLLLRSGEYELVEEIVRTHNLIRVPELRDDPRVSTWLEARGLTLEEAALIQPSYSPPPDGGARRVSSHYETATVGLSIATAALASYAAMAEPARGAPWVDALIIGAALGHTSLILHSRDSSVEESTWAIGLNVVGVIASIGSEVLRITRRGSVRIERAEASHLRTYVRPGLHGTEIGFAIRH